MRPKYAVAISYKTAETLHWVRPVAESLVARLGAERVFFDRSQVAASSGMDADLFFDQLFATDAEVAVAVLSPNYGGDWTACEWRRIRERLRNERGARSIMLLGAVPDETRKRLGLTGGDMVTAFDWFLTTDHVADAICERLNELRRAQGQPACVAVPDRSLPAATRAAIDAKLNHYRDAHRYYRRLAKLASRFLAGQTAEFLGRPEAEIFDNRVGEVLSAAALRTALERLAWRSSDPASVSLDLSNVQDLAVARLVFFEQEDIDRLVASNGVTLRQWLGGAALPSTDEPGARDTSGGPQTLRFRVARGTPFYEALPTEDRERLEGLAVEVQLRTLLQHAQVRLATARPRRRSDDRATFEGAADPTSGYLIVADHTAPPDRIEQERALFSIDAEMGVPGFRAAVWSRLPAGFRERLSHDGLVARVRRWDPVKRTLHLQPARYIDQMVSNHVPAHHVSVGGKEVRARAGTPPAWRPFEDSPLGNNIGVAAMMRTSDDRWVIPLRASHPAYEPDKLGCSVSGGLEWLDAPPGGAPAAAWWEGRILDECEEELGFRPRPKEVRFLALAREHLRLGKPQIFLWIELLDVSVDQVRRYWRLNSDGEHVELFDVGDSEAEQLSRATRYAGHAVSAELRMNLHLALVRRRSVRGGQ